MSKGKDTESSTNDSGFYSTELKSGQLDSSSDRIGNEDKSKFSAVANFIPMHLQPQLNRVKIVNSEHFFEQDEDGFTRLHIAVLHSDQRSIDGLLSIVPDISYVNLRNSYGMSPLHIAVMLQDAVTIHKLLDNGCSPNLRCAGKHSLHLAVENSDFQSAQIILSAVKNAANEPLVDLEMWNREGETAFIVACKNKDFRMAKLLMSKGCNVNAREGRAGYTALHNAVETSAHDVIDFLLDNHVDVNAENYRGWTAYQLCLINDFEQLASKLVTSGAIPYYTEEEQDESMSSSDELENSELISKISEITVN